MTLHRAVLSKVSDLVPPQTLQMDPINPFWEGQLRVRPKAGAHRVHVGLKFISPSLAPGAFLV